MSKKLDWSNFYQIAAQAETNAGDIRNIASNVMLDNENEADAKQKINIFITNLKQNITEIETELAKI